MPFIPNTDKDRAEMFAKIGVKNFEALLAPIPEHLRLKEPLNIPQPLSEMEVKKLLHQLASNNVTGISFIGAGSYDHYIPSLVDYVISRPEFYTAYTPYQPEASQGTLQTIYEYQSMICELFNMDIANASMYDGGSAIAEACKVASNANSKTTFLISEGVNPNYRKCVETYFGKKKVKIIPLKNGQTDIEAIKDIYAKNKDIACTVIQSPNFLGILEPVKEISSVVHSVNSLFIGVPLPISLGMLTPPGEWGADIAVAEGQAFGISQAFGGPGLGILSCKKDFVRSMPGRIIGKTQDSQGRRGFVMTLQTREQHIKRERATSNICTNEGLCAIAACVYLTVMGPQGLKEVGELCYNKAHYLAKRICEINGFKLVYEKPFFNEFVVSTPVSAEKIVNKLAKKKIFAGVPVSKFYSGHKNELLIAVTEKRTKEEIDYFVDSLKNIK
ncbi:MAG: aminomethyl-transferring glycine dehydrogenase subunit GcvPA [bacterium]|nr:aminomethyl-transferring glycine dehydrogenase subunit GcvPA [bacterium]